MFISASLLYSTWRRILHYLGNSLVVLRLDAVVETSWGVARNGRLVTDKNLAFAT
jgi:hypothetical protein